MDLPGIILSVDALVQCGSYQMKWDRFVQLVGWVHTCGHSASVDWLDTNPLLVWDAQTVYQKQKTDRTSMRSLSRALLRTRNRDATDSRDKIYALFGILPDHPGIAGRELYPAYSLSKRKVYIAIAKYCLILEQDLMILSATRARKDPDDLPSWVADCECKDAGQLLVARRTDGLRSFKASGGTRPTH